MGCMADFWSCSVGAKTWGHHVKGHHVLGRKRLCSHSFSRTEPTNMVGWINQCVHIVNQPKRGFKATKMSSSAARAVSFRHKSLPQCTSSHNGLWSLDLSGQKNLLPKTRWTRKQSHNQFSNNHDWFKNLKNLLAKSQSLWACSFPVTKLDAHPRHRLYQWPIQVPKSEVPTIYKAYFLGLEGDIHLK
jgi:hypothetical protein